MRNSSTKTLWHLRLKGIAATAGIGTIYGLLFANLLFAPLLPHLAAQSNSPTNNAPTNSVHRDVFYNNPEFRDAASREDCDRILQEVLEDIEKKNKAINAAYDAAKKCDTTYDESLTTNDLAHKAAYASAANTGKGLLLTCLGLGTPVATGVSARVGWISGGKISITLARVGTGVLGGITFLASLAYCKRLANRSAQDEIDVADLQKAHADKVALRKRDNCRETTNYERAKRKFQRWHRRGGKTSRGQGGHWWAKRRANADHAKCLALFPSGDCGTTD